MQAQVLFPKRAILAVILIISFLVPPVTTYALYPFGGRITTYFPICVNGVLLTIGPPRGGSFMYTFGSYSYAQGPPTHPGQQMLGRAGPPMICFVPCPTGLCPAGAGLTILFHGSSAI